MFCSRHLDTSKPIILCLQSPSLLTLERHPPMLWCFSRHLSLTIAHTKDLSHQRSTTDSTFCRIRNLSQDDYIDRQHAAWAGSTKSPVTWGKRRGKGR